MAKFLVLVFLTSLCEIAIAHAQEKTKPPAASHRKTVLLVDTDDPCRLSVDEDDQGVITPAEGKKITIAIGEHVVKCSIEDAPDLVWRKVVDAGQDQVAAMVALKSLHLQYNQALDARKQQQEQAQAEEEKQKQYAEHLPEITFANIKGTWRWKGHQTFNDAFGSGSVDSDVTLEFQDLKSGTIITQITYDDYGEGFRGHEAWLGSVSVSSASVLAGDAEFSCLEATKRIGRDTQRRNCPHMQNVQIKLLHAKHIQLTSSFFKEAKVLTR